MAGKIVFGSASKPPTKIHDIRSLDLAFAMDSTASMGGYIDAAKSSICKIVEEIVSSEKGDVRMALVNFRDHPPQDNTYVTEVHDFTSSSSTMKGWLASTKAAGGGDAPEAVADALQEMLKLSWRGSATKICVCISDAPPHGLHPSGDSFPYGCPLGIDPMNVVRQMAAKGITLYVAGCEPSIIPYKDFFTAIAYMTGGQYVPLTQAGELSKVIIGGAREEMRLERLMEEVNEEVRADIATGRSIDEAEMTRRVHRKMISKGVTTKQLQRNKVALASAADSAEASHISKLTNLSDVRAAFKASPTTTMGAIATPAAPAFSMRSVSDALAGSIGDEKYDVDEKPISEAQANRMVKKGLARNKVALAIAAESAEASHISKLTNLSDVRAAFKASPTPAMGTMATSAAPAFSIGSVREALAGSIGEEKYDVVEKPISEAQANRMVKKSLARNMISKKQGWKRILKMIFEYSIIIIRSLARNMISKKQGWKRILKMIFEYSIIIIRIYSNI